MEEDGDDERRAQENQPLDVLRDESEIRRSIFEQAGRQERLPAGSFSPADVDEEPEQENCTDRRENRRENVVRPDLQDREHEAEQADGRENRADRVEGSLRVGRERIDDAAPAQKDDSANDEGLEHERSAPADSRRDETSDQRSGGGTDTSHPHDRAEGLGPRREVVEGERGEDVYGGNQQGRPHAFEDGVAEDQHAEARGNRAQHGADSIQDEPHREAPLPPPTVRQLAAGDHQDCHDQ